MHRTLTEQALEHALQETGSKTESFWLPDIRNRKAYDALPEDVRMRVIREGERVRTEDWPGLFSSDYLEFSGNGNRSHFEDKYFCRRRMLCALTAAECIENKGRFLKDILNGLYLILEETSWCLPAHNTYIRDAKQLPLPDPARPVIDLFAAETGALAALCEYLLRPVLLKISPFISKYVDDELRKRIFEPYFREHFWWMGNGREPVCNWTVWCTQNILLAALSHQDSVLPEGAKLQVLRKAAVSVDYFLDEYGPDGCCDEGAQYFSHAGLTFFNCIDLMDQAVGGRMQSLFAEPLIRNIASYIVKVYAGNGCYINFADCSVYAGRRTARDYLFGRRTHNPVLTAFAAADYREGEEKGENLLLQSGEINLYHHLQQIFCHEEMMSYPPEKTCPEDVYFESCGLMAVRDGHFVLAVKAGDNADSHNHNDTGSVILYKDGKPFLIDLGVETYTEKTFSDRRYEIWTMQSGYHNLPTFYPYKNDTGSEESGKSAQAAPADVPIMEKAGSRYCAKDVRCTLGERECRMSMDIAAAYDDPGVVSYLRTVTFCKGEKVEIEDEYTGSRRCVLSLMTYEKPVPAEHDETAAKGDYVLKLGTLGSIILHNAAAVQIQELPIRDPRLGQVWKHDCYRILATCGDGRLTVAIPEETV